jgi:hypothetical protein
MKRLVFCGLLSAASVVLADSQRGQLSSAGGDAAGEFERGGELLFVGAGILPRNAASDAVHLAVAAVANTDYVLTWNFRHIASAELLKQLNRVCSRCGYRLTAVCTPEELLGGNANV